ncbi:MAG: DUF998 domain-containing protein [Candidatus Micrarchaeota archaeon]|nr:DUF998 domain-containing protein [Candidatus Micrarchaeota archaeon]
MKMTKREASRTAGRLIIIAAIEVVFFILLAQHLYPGYSLTNNYISDLGVGGTAPIFNLAMQLFGLLLITSSYFLCKSGRKYASVAFFIIGLGGFCVGTFPETTGLPHIVSALITFDGASVTALGFYKVFKGYLSYYSLAAGAVGILITFLFIFNIAAGTQITFGLGHGGIEEILFYDELLWALIAGFYFATGRV